MYYRISNLSFLICIMFRCIMSYRCICIVHVIKCCGGFLDMATLRKCGKLWPWRLNNRKTVFANYWVELLWCSVLPGFGPLFCKHYALVCLYSGDVIETWCMSHFCPVFIAVSWVRCIPVRSFVGLVQDFSGLIELSGWLLPWHPKSARALKALMQARSWKCQVESLTPESCRRCCTLGSYQNGC